MIASAGYPARLREARERSGISVRALAKAIGSTPASIWAWEAGKYFPGIDVVEKLATALGVEPGWLAYGDKEPT